MARMAGVAGMARMADVAGMARHGAAGRGTVTVMMGGGEGTAIPDDGAGGGRGGVGQVVHGHDVCSRAAAVRATTGYQFFQTQMVIQRVHLGLSAATDSRGTSTVSLSFLDSRYCCTKHANHTLHHTLFVAVAQIFVEGWAGGQMEL